MLLTYLLPCFTRYAADILYTSFGKKIILPARIIKNKRNIQQNRATHTRVYIVLFMPLTDRKLRFNKNITDSQLQQLLRTEISIPSDLTALSPYIPADIHTLTPRQLTYNKIFPPYHLYTQQQQQGTKINAHFGSRRNSY